MAAERPPVFCVTYTQVIIKKVCCSLAATEFAVKLVFSTKRSKAVLQMWILFVIYIFMIYFVMLSCLFLAALCVMFSCTFVSFPK